MESKPLSQPSRGAGRPARAQGHSGRMNTRCMLAFPGLWPSWKPGEDQPGLGAQGLEASSFWQLLAHSVALAEDGILGRGGRVPRQGDASFHPQPARAGSAWHLRAQAETCPGQDSCSTRRPELRFVAAGRQGCGLCPLRKLTSVPCRPRAAIKLLTGVIVSDRPSATSLNGVSHSAITGGLGCPGLPRPRFYTVGLSCRCICSLSATGTSPVGGASQALGSQRREGGSRTQAQKRRQPHRR